jgi:hypothetical protein
MSVSAFAKLSEYISRWCQTNSNQSQFAGKHANLCGTKKAPLGKCRGAVEFVVLS